MEILPLESLSLDLWVFAALCVMSFLAGFIDSIAGGGGLILLPALLVAGLPPQLALGTNKLSAICGVTTSLANFARSGKILWKIAAMGLPFSLLGAMAGSRVVLLLNQTIATKIILFILPVIAVITLFPHKELKTATHMLSKKAFYLYTPLICLVLGFYDGFFGPGTGTFLIFGFFFFLKLHLVNASGLAKVFNFASNLGAFVVFAASGSILYRVGLPAALFNILGAYIGSRLAISKGQPVIRFFLLLVFGLLFITLIIKV